VGILKEDIKMKKHKRPIQEEENPDSEEWEGEEDEE
jgi:hypothetical protein